MNNDGYLSPEFLETLLNMHESETLDFKREQYRIEKASNDEKGEFVKDIIAFANSWKTGDAYILIGIEEVPGSRASVLGIPQHIDDAKLQQLVNTKTNVPVQFSYIAVSIDGKKVGVSRIKQEQQRPICLKRDFGKLRKETVYIRRSSSTDEASVVEIARMGSVAGSGLSSVPVIEIGFGHVRERKQYGTSIEAFPCIFKAPTRRSPRELLDTLEKQQVRSLQIPAEFRSASIFPKPSPEQLRKYHQEIAQLVPIELYIKNVGQVVAGDVQVELSIPFVDGLEIIEEAEHPRNRRSGPYSLILSAPCPSRNIALTKTSENWLIEASFGKVQPQAVSWLYEYAYISTRESMRLDISARILDDNLSKPIEVAMQIEVSPQEIEYDPSDWKELEE